MSMTVTDAVFKRKSIRQFLDKPVSNEAIGDLLTKAARAPSGGNVQPWRVYVINGPSMTAFMEHMQSAPPQKVPGYEIYPKDLKPAYHGPRVKVAEDMYALLNIARDDRAARNAHTMLNFEFFGAPAAIFCCIDKQMGPPQWSDLGMFLQTFMLLATEVGLDTCPQEAWTFRSEAIEEFVGAEEDLMLFCGIAIGHADPEAPVNTLVSERSPIEEWAHFVE